MKRLIPALVLSTMCVFTIYTQDYNVDANEIISIFKIVRKNRSNQQSEIIDFDSLPGTFWVIDDSNHGYSASSYAYIFLKDNMVIVVTSIKNEASNIIPDEVKDVDFFSIDSIVSAVKYKVEQDKIIIFDKLSGYIQDTYLYFGDTTYGFIKYKLYSTFPVDSVFDSWE
jgi:hypothetical protein